MHKRKKYTVYPPNYTPGDGYTVKSSRFQAWKAAKKLGAGSKVMVSEYIYSRPSAYWYARSPRPLWDIEKTVLVDVGLIEIGVVHGYLTLKICPVCAETLDEANPEHSNCICSENDGEYFGEEGN